MRMKTFGVRKITGLGKGGSRKGKGQEITGEVRRGEEVDQGAQTDQNVEGHTRPGQDRVQQVSAGDGMLKRPVESSPSR